MPDVIFARPRWDYPSYTDLYRLIELSGYPLIYLDEIDASSDNTYIMTVANGENANGWQSPRARIILYDLEWHLEGVNIPGVSEIWAADAWYAEKIGAKYVPLGSHADLKLRDDTPNGREYDAATLWYVSPRRQQVINAFTAQRITTAPDSVWGEDRHSALMKSRCMVHVHQRDDAFTVAPQRFALAAAYSLPMITETLTDCGIFKYSYRLMSNLNYMGAFVSMWTKPTCTTLLEDYGRALNRLLCHDHTFRKVVERSV